MKNKLLVLLVAIITGFGIVRAESIDLLDSTVTVNESSVFGHSKTVYQYNNKGSLIRQTRIYATWSKWKVGVPMIMNRRAVFVYDDEGHEIDLYYSSLDTATGKWTDDHRYLYDEWHNRTYSVGKWNADSTALLSGVRYFYDSNHFLIGNESFDTWNGVEVVTDKYFYTNNANGYKISMYGQFRPDSAYDGDYKSDPEKFNQSGWKNVDSAYYERNAAGQSIRETFFRWDESNNQWLKDGYQDFTYDAQGHLLTDTVFARDFETNIIIYNNMTVREYDSYGNLTRTTTYSPVVSEGETQWQVNDVSVNEYTYNEKGLITLKRSHTDYNDGAEPNYSTTTYYYSHYDLDENGNIVPEPCLIASGTCGDNLTWELSCDSVLTISGSGAMTSAPWIKSYKTAIKNAIIEDGVTNVYWAAFYYCSNLKSVTIGNSVTQIEGYAFYECTGLTSVTIPNKVIGIGNSAFSGCRGLTTISLPNSLTTIEDWAFSNCRVLTSVTIPQNVDSIGQAAFGGCFSLIEINVVSENSHFCSVDGVVFNKAMTTLVQYPGGVQGDYIIPNSVTAVAWGAFWNCPNMTGIKIPSGVTSLGERGFTACKGLTSITCEAVTPPTCGTEEFYGVDKSIPVYVPAESVNAYKSASYWNEFTNIQPICETIETEETIYLCSGTTLMWYGMSYSGSGDYTQTLVTIHGCDSIVTLHLIELPLLTGDTTAFITKGSSFIWHGVSFTAENTPATHAYISKNTPECDSIVTLHIIEIEDPAPCLIASGTCGENLTWELDCEGVLTISGTGEMTNYEDESPALWYEHKESISAVVIKNGITSIGDRAFYVCRNLTSVEIPNSITSIGYMAFSTCTSLTSVTIPNSITSIGDYAFCGCSGLTSITNHATTPQIIDANVFGGIVYDWGSDASWDVDKSIPLYVPGQSIDLYKAANGWKDFFNILPIQGTEVPEYPVIFLNYNSDVLSEQSVAHNSAAVAPEVPEREGYIFKGWNVDISHITVRTFAIALYDKVGVEVTYKAEDGETIFSEHADLHLPAAPIIAGKSFKGWLTESADSENGIVLRATYTFDNPTTHDDVTITPSSNSAYVIFPFITGALTYQLVIRDLFGNVVCKIMFSATGHLLGIAFAPSRNRESQQATQTTGFNFTVEGLDANTTYEYEFVANDDTDEVIETLSGSFTTTAEVPTDNEQVNSPSAARKYLDDGHLMIDANSHIFNTQGKMIK